MKQEFIYMDMIAPSFILLPLVMAMIRYRVLPPGGKILFFYLLFDTVVSVLSSWMAFHQQINLPLYHVATIIDTVLLLFFFHAVFRHLLTKRFIRIMIWLFPVLCVLNILWLQPLSTFNSYALSFKSMLIITLCFLYWWHHELPEGASWGSQAVNWMISGLLLYFSSSFILFTFSNVIIASSSSKNISQILWNIHATLSIIMFVMMAIGLSRYKHER